MCWQMVIPYVFKPGSCNRMFGSDFWSKCTRSTVMIYDFDFYDFYYIRLFVRITD